MDTISFSSFGKLQYIHVSIDPYSHLINEICHLGENVGQVQQHCQLLLLWVFHVPYKLTVNFHT